MSGDAWPKDPADPRCPACGEPVSATADYCMHCERDLPAWRAAPDATGTATDPAPVPGSEEDPTEAATAEEAGGPRRAAKGAAWIDPDSRLDDVSTALVGVVVGVLVIPLAAPGANGCCPPRWGAPRSGLDWPPARAGGSG